MALTSSPEANADALLSAADTAMYKAKKANSGIVIADERIRWEVNIIRVVDRDMKEALERGDFKLHYQPVCSLGGRREVLGCEARWHHPEQGLIPPPMLMERLEAAKLIQPFTEWTLEQAAADLAWLRQQDSDWALKGLAINLNASQLESPDYIKAHMDALHRHGLRDEDFIVELVEIQHVVTGSQAEQSLIELAKRGVTVGLDDFGAGHNVLGYFSQFPIHSIKLDRSLIVELPTNPTVRTVVKGLVRMADELGSKPSPRGSRPMNNWRPVSLSAPTKASAICLANLCRWSALKSSASISTDAWFRRTTDLSRPGLRTSRCSATSYCCGNQHHNRCRSTCPWSTASPGRLRHARSRSAPPTRFDRQGSDRSRR